VPEEHLEHDINGKQEQGEHRQHGHRKDAALELLGNDRVEMTDEQVSLPARRDACANDILQSSLVARKVDRFILPPLCWVYFLQILDKSCVGYGANFGLQTEAVCHSLLLFVSLLLIHDIAPRGKSILFGLLFWLLGSARCLLRLHGLSGCSRPHQNPHERVHPLLGSDHDWPCVFEILWPSAREPIFARNV
jgi:hypothetical protein